MASFVANFSLTLCAAVTEFSSFPCNSMNRLSGTEDIRRKDRFATPVAIYADNPPHVINRAAFLLLNGIGVVQRLADFQDKDVFGHSSYDARIGRATAFNISPCYVLTNAHVAFGEYEVGQKGSQGRMVFSVGVSDRAEFAQQSILTPEIRGDLGTRDFALARDSKCSGFVLGYYKPSFKTSEELARIHAKVVLVSFPGNVSAGQLVVSSGIVTSIDPKNGYLKYTVSAGDGSSGGVVFIVDDETHEYQVVGIHVGYITNKSLKGEFEKFDENNANEFMNIREILLRSDVSDLLQRDISIHNNHNPITPYLKAPR